MTTRWADMSDNSEQEECHPSEKKEAPVPKSQLPESKTETKPVEADTKRNKPRSELKDIQVIKQGEGCSDKMIRIFNCKNLAELEGLKQVTGIQSIKIIKENLYVLNFPNKDKLLEFIQFKLDKQLPFTISPFYTKDHVHLGYQDHPAPRGRVDEKPARKKQYKPKIEHKGAGGREIYYDKAERNESNRQKYNWTQNTVHLKEGQFEVEEILDQIHKLRIPSKFQVLRIQGEKNQRDKIVELAAKIAKAIKWFASSEKEISQTIVEVAILDRESNTLVPRKEEISANPEYIAHLPRKEESISKTASTYLEPKKIDKMEQMLFNRGCSFDHVDKINKSLLQNCTSDDFLTAFLRIAARIEQKWDHYIIEGYGENVRQILRVGGNLGSKGYNVRYEVGKKGNEALCSAIISKPPISQII